MYKHALSNGNMAAAAAGNYGPCKYKHALSSVNVAAGIAGGYMAPVQGGPVVNTAAPVVKAAPAVKGPYGFATNTRAHAALTMLAAGHSMAQVKAVMGRTFYNAVKAAAGRGIVITVTPSK